MMIKRLFDIGTILIFSPIFIPLIFIISLVLFIKQGLPIFFVQNRVGKNNKIFKLYKFRTMEVSAEEDFHKSHYLDLAKGKNIEPSNSPLEPIRIENDDRITSLGTLLRKTSLDELPNILNVLKGDMSLVGPRPLVGYESDLYGKYNSKRNSVLPGVTGLAQVQGRLDLSLQERLYWDLKYIEDNSFSDDIKIIIKTISSVLTKKGAN
ncbi:MAG: sugar transferase [Candidatus Actinomarina sp.]|tara:strand:- start:439 stop:1062 length:624 start_codon:yes stop_codon:yes gene_type:complete